MFVSGVLDITNDFVYQSQSQFSFSSFNLSRFLLNIYLRDLDEYLNFLCRFLSFRKFIFSYKKNINSFNLFKYKNLIKCYYPIKVLSLLRINFIIKKLRVSKFIHFKNYYETSVSSIFSFEKKINYLRYIDHFIIGVLGSKDFFSLIYRKILAFIRSNICFDLEKTSYYSTSKDSIIFLGFNIKLIYFDNLNVKSVYMFKTNKRYFSRILHRIEIYDKIASKTIMNRINFELNLQLNTLIKSSKEKSFFIFDYSKKVWLYLFQAEAVRASKYGRLFLTEDKIFVLSEEIFTSIKFNRNLNYQRYLFYLYILKMQQLLTGVIKFSFTSSRSFLSSFDMTFNKLLKEHRKKYFLYYNKFFISFSSCISYQNKIKKDSLYNVRVYSNSYCLINSMNSFNSQVLFRFEIFFPVNFSIEILRSLGFFHPFKSRPIGKSSILNFDDVSIIKFFGYFSFLILRWYRCCVNFSSVKNFINIFRESCFLTLSRKHNKNKSWVYEVYTYELNIFDNLFSNKSFFPSRTILFRMKRKFFIFNSNKFFNDKFFLNL